MRRRKRDIIIELTSLLDVIMILIFMVMNENSKLVAQSQQEVSIIQQQNAEQTKEIDDLTAQLAEALAQLDEGDRQELLNRLHETESRLNSYLAMDDVATIITVELKSLPGSELRWLIYGKSDDLQTREIRNDDEFRKSVDMLAVYINDYGSQTTGGGSDPPTVYVVFSYDPYGVRYSDVQVIKNKVDRIKDDNNFIYLEKEILKESN